MRHFLRFFCVLFASTTLASTVAESLSTEVRKVFDRCKGAVVKVEATDRVGALCGTGFFIDSNGTLLTSYSVGGENTNLIIRLANNTKIPAKCLVADARAGVAILQAEKVPVGTPFLPLAKIADLSVATPVVAVAYPMDMPLTPAFGLVAGQEIKYQGRYFATTHIRASVPVQRGQSGAPLLNMEGQVIGVITSGIDNGSACFALPIVAVEKIRRDYDNYGALKPGWLGVKVRVAGTALQGSSAEVDRLENNAPAEQAGLQPGDILLKIGKTAIHSPQDVFNASFFLTAGEKTTLIVLRGDRELTLQAAPGERPTVEPAQSTAPASVSDIILRLREH